MTNDEKTVRSAVLISVRAHVESNESAGARVRATGFFGRRFFARKPASTCSYRNAHRFLEVTCDPR